MPTERQYRLVYASLSTSKKIKAVKGKRVSGEKWWRISCHLVYTWLVIHADDDGRLRGRPGWIVENVLPYEELSPEEVAGMLEELHRVGLIVWYEIDSERFIQIVPHPRGQQIKKDRYHSSIYPPPPEMESNGDKIGTETETNGADSVGRFPSPSPSPSPLNLQNNHKDGYSVGSVLLDATDFVKLYNTYCPDLTPASERISKDRRKKINDRLKECKERDWWIQVFQKANRIYIPAHEGHPQGWRPDIWFIIKNADNSIKIMEGKYTMRPGPNPKAFSPEKLWAEGQEAKNGQSRPKEISYPDGKGKGDAPGSESNR